MTQEKNTREVTTKDRVQRNKNVIFLPSQGQNQHLTLKQCSLPLQKFKRTS